MVRNPGRDGSDEAAPAFRERRGRRRGQTFLITALILGIAETLTGFYISTGYKDVPGLILLLAVLAVRPVGLFSPPRRP
jgi:ABC-type Mn2+/Zn2+ transport system permease subunit